MSKQIDVFLAVRLHSDACKLDGIKFPFRADGSTALDLVKHVQTTWDLPDDADYQVKYKTVDLYGERQIATLTLDAKLEEGEVYYVFIRPKDDDGATFSQPFHGTPLSTRGQTSVFTPSPRLSMSSPRTPQPRDRFASPLDTEDNNSSLAEQEPYENLLQDCSASTSMAPPMTSNDSSSAPVLRELSRQLNPTLHANKGLFLVDLYAENRTLMDEEFKIMKPLEPFIFHNVDVMKELNTPRTIAALVLIRNNSMTDYDDRVADAAREYAQKAAVDVVMAAKQTTSLPRNGIQPLISFLSKMVNNDFFATLGRPGGPIMESARKRQSRAARRNGIPPRKKARVTFAEHEMDEINEAGNAAAAATTMEEIEEIMRLSSTARCEWISSMAQGKTLLIPETVIAKFPRFKENATLLKYDFAYTMENVFQLPLFDVGKALHSFAPAILALSVSKQIRTQEEASAAQGNMLVVGKCLIELVASYCRQKKKCVADRLIVESQGTPSVNAMLAYRKEIKQNAPMIFIFDTYPGTIIYIACDDFALKVPGEFAQALQCLTYLHYVFNLEYAKEMLQFNLLLENLCEINVKSMDKTRVNLYYDLKAKQRVLSNQEPASSLSSV